MPRRQSQSKLQIRIIEAGGLALRYARTIFVNEPSVVYFYFKIIPNQ